MLLTVTSTAPEATDLGFLLHKHPAKVQSFARLRERGLGRNRSLALRKYALGLEALERFRDDEPLWRVHEAVFAVLALESEPVDPRR